MKISSHKWGGNSVCVTFENETSKISEDFSGANEKRELAESLMDVVEMLIEGEDFYRVIADRLL